MIRKSICVNYYFLANRHFAKLGFFKVGNYPKILASHNIKSRLPGCNSWPGTTSTLDTLPLAGAVITVYESFSLASSTSTSRCFTTDSATPIDSALLLIEKRPHLFGYSPVFSVVAEFPIAFRPILWQPVPAQIAVA